MYLSENCGKGKINWVTQEYIIGFPRIKLFNVYYKYIIHKDEMKTAKLEHRKLLSFIYIWTKLIQQINKKLNLILYDCTKMYFKVLLLKNVLYVQIKPRLFCKIKICNYVFQVQNL